MLGNVIAIPAPSNSLTSMSFPRKTFMPYRSFQFVLTVKKGERTVSDQAIIMFQEFDLPALALDVPDNLKNNRINLNDEVFMKINYPAEYSPDSLFYSATFIYNFDEVATLIFKFVTVRFQIWQKFTAFDPADNTLIVRFSVYNPIFMMPSQMTVTLKVNIPPRDCQLAANVVTGEALVTDFVFSVSGCVDDDLPLTYKFFMYKSFNDSVQEIINPIPPRRIMLSEFTANTQVSTKLPQGFTEFEMQYTVLASVRDSVGGLTNLTINVTVNNNSYVQQNNSASYLATL